MEQRPSCEATIRSSR